jgi:MoaA/NifB/PqqE/SkfB family radical SAM enzyme
MRLFGRETFCPRLWDEIYINERGQVFSCCHEGPQVLGNIYEARIEDICNNDIIRRQRKASLKGRLRCYKQCTLLDKSAIVAEDKPLTIDYSELKRLKVMFGEGCNIDCIMCQQNGKSRDYLDHEKLIENIALSPFELVEIQGGEPLFIKPARLFFDFVASQGKKTSMLTNGMLVTERWAEKIARHGSFIHFSLNAASKETHERVNRGSRWEVVLRNIQRVRAAREKHQTDVSIRGHMTIVPENVHEVPLFIRKHQELGFDWIDFGFDFSVPQYLRTQMDASERQALKQEIAAALEEQEDTSRVELNRLRLLGLV